MSQAPQYYNKSADEMEQMCDSYKLMEAGSQPVIKEILKIIIMASCAYFFLNEIK
jgi:hypothetical protein